MMSGKGYYQEFRDAFWRCCTVDEEFDNRYFHVLMENPTDRYLVEGRQKIEALGDRLAPEYREDLLSFLSALGAIRGDLGREEWIARLYDEAADLRWVKASGQYRAVHDVCGFPLCDEEIARKAADTAADVLFNFSFMRKKMAEDGGASAPFSLSYLELVCSSLMQRTAGNSVSALVVLATDNEVQGLKKGEEHRWESWVQRVYQVCEGLAVLPDTDRLKALDRMREDLNERWEKAREDAEKKARLIAERRAVLPGFAAEKLGDRLGWMSEEDFQTVSRLFERYAIRDQSDWEALLSDVNALAYWLGK